PDDGDDLGCSFYVYLTDPARHRLERYHGGEQFPAWLAWHLERFLNRAARQSWRWRAVLSDTEDAARWTSPLAVEDAALAGLEKAALRKRLATALRQLPKPERRLFYLR